MSAFGRGRISHFGGPEKDLIIRGGFNVYPRDVEYVLMTHLRCDVGGGRPPDPLRGEEVVAYLSLRPGTSDRGLTTLA